MRDNKSKKLAQTLFECFGCIEEAHSGYRRAMQNNCSLLEFEKLLKQELTINAKLHTFTPEMNNTLACKLGEIQRHLVEDTELLTGISEMGIDLSHEIDGYDCVITALFQLQKHADNNI